MQKVLVICGPTATGKTKLGIELAKKFDGEIISVDSRQVYTGMDIGTGKGISPEDQFSIANFQTEEMRIGYYVQNNVKVWGYDLVKPNEPFSVAHFERFGRLVLTDIHARNKLPILVGGTGLYIKSLTQHIPTAHIPQDQDLRQELVKLSVPALQDRLKQIDPEKLAAMNNSDIQNPRRLIRAIEIAKEKSNSSPQSRHHQMYDQLWIGLISPLEKLREAVTQNVLSRAGDKLTQEITHLEESSMDWNSPAGSATGYTEWRMYLSGDVSKEVALNQWILREHNYQKRQLTWFKKLTLIHWFDNNQLDYIQAVEDLVSPWYSKNQSYGISN